LLLFFFPQACFTTFISPHFPFYPLPVLPGAPPLFSFWPILYVFVSFREHLVFSLNRGVLSVWPRGGDPFSVRLFFSGLFPPHSLFSLVLSSRIPPNAPFFPLGCRAIPPPIFSQSFSSFRRSSWSDDVLFSASSLFPFNHSGIGHSLPVTDFFFSPGSFLYGTFFASVLPPPPFLSFILECARAANFLFPRYTLP